ncbi:CBM_collapsed_G0026730.mRNA.1.CDS.1 [Saccharomyces cerevisiae]|nr:CBM_collapsed_G0026730.mRNA.1.CDS.1 [Saccharomyces cerevisiae]
MSNKASDQSARTASILKTDITRENTITRSSSSNNDNYHHHNNINNYNESAKTGEDANKENIPNLEEEIAAFRIFRKKSTSNLKSSHTTSNLDPKRKLQLQQRFASPTDRLVSPCSLKLNEHKVKMFGKKKKVNPMKLNFKGNLAADSEDVEIDEDEEYFY